MRDVGLVVASSLVVWGAAGIACRLRLGRRIDTVLATATLATFQVVASVLFIGVVVRRLSPIALLGVTVVVSGPIVWFTRNDLNVVRLVRMSRRGRLSPVWTMARRHPWAALLASLAAVEFAWRMVISFAVLPYGWDALAYHLPTVATWVRAGRIVFVPYDVFSNVYPANGEVVTAWIATFTHSSFGLAGVQLPFGVFGAAAVMSLARTVGVSRSGAVAAGALFFLTPVVVAQTTSSYVDLTAAALVLTSVAFGIRVATTPSDDDLGLRLRLLVLCGIAGGLAIGTKTTAIPYVGILAVVLVVLEGRRHGVRQMSGALAALGLPVLVLGSFWYARVWIHYGNPLYPFRVRIGSVQVFDGPDTTSRYLDRAPASLGGVTFLQPVRSWLHDLVSWRPSVGYTYDGRIGGFGAVWAAVELPLLAVVTWVSVRRRDTAFVLLVSVCVVGWYAQPYSWWTRFSMPLLAPGIIALVISIERLALARARNLLMYVSGGLIVATVGFGSLFLQTGSGETISSAAILRRALTLGLGAVDRSADPTTLRWLDALSANEPIAVKAGMGPFFFTAFGEQLSHPVIPIEPDSLESLVAAMRASPATVLAATPNSDVDQWAASDPQHFHPFSDLAPVESMRFATLGRVYRFTP